MRLAPCLLFLALLGAPAGLEAARPARKGTATVHTVRRGETAARIARASGLTLQQLEDLNPKVDLARLTAGTVLKVKGKPAPKAAPRAVPVEAVPAGAEPVPPLAPVPALPVKGPAVLVHLERLLPAGLE